MKTQLDSAVSKRTAWSGFRKLKQYPNSIRIASVVTFFLIWEFIAKDADPLFIATPSEIYEAAMYMIEEGTFLLIVRQSMEHFIIGTVLSMVLGVAIGVALALWWQVEYILDPFINGFYAIPKPALVPLIILWFGLETTSKVVIILSIAIFPMIVNTYVGIKDTRGSMLDIGRAFGASDVPQVSSTPATEKALVATISLLIDIPWTGVCRDEQDHDRSGPSLNRQLKAL